MSTESLLIEEPSFYGWWWLVRAYHGVLAGLNPFFEEWGITGAQFGVLRVLSDAGEEGLMLSDLSKRLLVTCGNTTGVVDRLEQAGLLRRERQQDDRRIIKARLTPNGVELFRKILPAYLEVLRGLMDGLTTEEKKSLGQLARDLYESVDQPKRREDVPGVVARAE